MNNTEDRHRLTLIADKNIESEHNHSDSSQVGIEPRKGREFRTEIFAYKDQPVEWCENLE